MIHSTFSVRAETTLCYTLHTKWSTKYTIKFDMRNEINMKSGLCLFPGIRLVDSYLSISDRT